MVSFSAWPQAGQVIVDRVCISGSPVVLAVERVAPIAHARLRARPRFGPYRRG